MDRRYGIALAVWVLTAIVVTLGAKLAIIGMLVGPAVLITAALFGFRGAVVGSCLGMPTHLIFSSLGGASYSLASFDYGLFLGHGFAAGFAFVVGWTVSLRERLERETDMRVASERARLQAELESKMDRADRLATVGTLATGLAHEVNNPLTYLLGAVESLRQRAAEQPEQALRWAELDEELSDIEDGAQRIEAIIRELELFIGEQGRPFESLSLTRVAETAVLLTRNQLAAGVELEQAFGGVPPIHGDPSRLAQVLVNLLTNAMQSIPAGEAGRIVFEVVEREGEVIASISDNGVGMSEEQRARAFDPFFTSKAVGVGTGLGLPVCASIMREHGGSIELDSELGVGTTCRLHFPRARARARA